MNHSSTYDPADDKLRLYPSARLSKEDYESVKSVGFRWAPKQELFFRVWTPQAEDLLLEWCDEIGDEDTTLVDRAEIRADRFDTYSENRANESKQHYAAVSAIADNIPLGQPILVAHHSERHARRDAEKIENGMRKAVNAWKTSEYWKGRAAGALAHAKYKELPGVRARRIKTLEAELRKVLRSKQAAADLLQIWTVEGLTLEQARFIAGRTSHGHLTVVREGTQYWSAYDVLQPDEERYKACPSKTVEDVQAAARRHHASVTAHCERWIEHLSHRLEYEHAMLEDQGAVHLLDKKPKSAAAQLPLCNYRSAEGLDIENEYHRGEMLHYAMAEMTQADYAKINQDYKGTRVVDNSHRVRIAYRAHTLYYVFITDSKTHERPTPIEKKPKLPPAPTQADLERIQQRNAAREEAKADAAPFEAIADALRTGVEVVVAPQLFVTPHDIAQQVAELADIKPDSTILEPSAGTGALINGIYQPHGRLVAIEFNISLAERLRQILSGKEEVICADFLECSPEIRGTFDRIIMNPPFEHGSDIKHIEHAKTFLKPGGRLVAICANGPRQNEKYDLQPLPAGSFKESGTMVNAAIYVYDAPEAASSTPAIETKASEVNTPATASIRTNAAKKAWETRRKKAQESAVSPA